MEALADQQLELAEDDEVDGAGDVGGGGGGGACEPESSVRAESLAKLAAFKENPHVNLNESKLANELKVILVEVQKRMQEEAAKKIHDKNTNGKVILEEAQRRMEAGEMEKKRKKEQKKVRMVEEETKNTRIQK